MKFLSKYHQDLCRYIDTIILESQRNQEENRKSRNIAKHICPTYFWQNCNSYSMEER